MRLRLYGGRRSNSSNLSILYEYDDVWVRHGNLLSLGIGRTGNQDSSPGQDLSHQEGPSACALHTHLYTTPADILLLPNVPMAVTIVSFMAGQGKGKGKDGYMDMSIRDGDTAAANIAIGTGTRQSGGRKQPHFFHYSTARCPMIHRHLYSTVKMPSARYRMASASLVSTV